MINPTIGRFVGFSKSKLDHGLEVFWKKWEIYEPHDALLDFVVWGSDLWAKLWPGNPAYVSCRMIPALSYTFHSHMICWIGADYLVIGLKSNKWLDHTSSTCNLRPFDFDLSGFISPKWLCFESSLKYGAYILAVRTIPAVNFKYSAL